MIIITWVPDDSMMNKDRDDANAFSRIAQLD